MKIAISAMGTTLDTEIDPRFGRCQYFIIVDPETMQFEAVENSGAVAGGGAGISTAQMIAGKGVGVVLTGNCGPNAYQVLTAAGVKVVTGISGKVQDAILNYKSGKLKTSAQPNVAEHFGTGRGMRRDQACVEDRLNFFGGVNMPKGDGTGPPTGRSQRGGRMRGNQPGAGPGGNCVCPGCGGKVPHRQGTPCYDLSCPTCGTKMMRE